MAHQPYDLIVLGGGSAGFNAARTAADLGRKAAILDGARDLGGLCILRGCMPSKTLLYSAERLHQAREGRRFGLRIPSARADLAAIQARKRRIIAEFAQHRLRQLKAGRFDLVPANARFLDARTVELSDGRRLTGRHFLIATGSRISVPPVPGLREAGAWTSDDCLDLTRAPRSLIVLGGGLVAVELAQFFARIGVRVTLIQRSAQLLREHSPEAAAAVRAGLEADGIEVLTGTAIERVARTRSGFTVTFQHARRRRERRAERLLNALGREANTAGLNLAAADVKLRPNGQVRTNRFQQTSAPHIYAAGDCAGPVEIVHIAVQQGELAARHAAGDPRARPIDYRQILSVVFTDPALATLGVAEAELRAKGVAYLAASYPFDDHGKSILMGVRRGFVRVLAEPRRGRLLGAEIVGPEAGELIHCLTGPLALRATVFDLLRAPWYHPTLAEILTYPLEEIAGKITAERRRRGRA
jgi:pyruvate/2-oxoglutarate dehydrogenase complex dihydrolipoamide dehydrogenase (E3) component